AVAGAVPSGFVSSFSAGDSGRRNPHHREKTVAQTLWLLFVWLGNRSGCHTIAAGWHQTAHERKRIKNRNLQAVWRVFRVDEEDSVSTIRPKKMARNRFRRLACNPRKRCWWRG